MLGLKADEAMQSPILAQPLLIKPRTAIVAPINRTLPTSYSSIGCSHFAIYLISMSDFDAEAAGYTMQ